MVDPLKILWVLTNSTYLVSKFLKNSDSSEDAPFFEHSLYQAEVRESEELRHHVITVTAENHDEEVVRYEITGGNIGAVFAMDPDTGAITLTSPLDYETRKQYSLQLSVTDGESVSYATLVIHVLDVNDNPPVFERTSYRTQITEEDDRNIPKKILQVNVTDADRDRPRDVVYFLTGPGVDTDEPSSAQFSINSTSGEIYVLKPLDRDLPNGRPQWRFTVFAQDEGGQGLVGYADIQVNLKDINDNAPLFPETLSLANVTENGTAGLMVLAMTAVDYDDPEEGGNAQLTYNIEKNVLDEQTGAAIFSIDSHSGEVRTAVCCLDREKTPDYTLQIVAMDGGGLKGTGTVSILVSDINDMPPVFTKEEWVTEVSESQDPSQATAILTVAVIDQDETNDFYYKVIEGSGFGTDKFSMVRNPDGTGSLRVARPLDFEDPLQRQGFRFKIQGPNSTEDGYHTAHSWVVVRLKDVNDNPPQLDKAEARVSLREDVKVGTLVEAFSARDPDQAGKSRVVFALVKGTDPRKHFKVSPEGRVTVQRPLDREKMPLHKLVLTAVDDGEPPLTASATLTITVLDVNDHAPSLLKDYRPVVTENGAPRVVVELFAQDADDHTAGHGPPYTFLLDPAADPVLARTFRVETNPKGDAGRGVAVVSSLVTLDREQQKEFLVPIVVRDSGTPPLQGTSTLTVTVGDVNDNALSPGSTEITAYKLEGLDEEMEVGRVYAADPDDWDLPDKTFSWGSSPLGYFSLDRDTGGLTMAADTPKGRYRMSFKVQDTKRGESVDSDVTVIVRPLFRQAVAHSQSVTLYGLTDTDFISSKNSSVSPSQLEMFRETVAQLLNTSADQVDVFSVQTRNRFPPQTDVRFSVRDHSQYFKPVRLSGLLLMHRNTLERSLGVSMRSAGPDQCLHESTPGGCETEGSCSPRLTVLPAAHLVVANTTGLAAPQLQLSRSCVCAARDFRRPETCHTTPCLNHGTCLETRHGPVCSCSPDHDGPRCQQTSRGFHGTGWAWYPGLALCSRSHLSLEFITSSSEGTLLYNGPVAPPNPNNELIPDFISLELLEQAVQLLVNFGSGTVNLTLPAHLDDGEWHRVDIIWDPEEVRLVLDQCKSPSSSSSRDSSDHDWRKSDSATCLASSPLPLFLSQLNLDTPLQLGGVYTQSLDPVQYGWIMSPSWLSFDGCIRNLVFNGEILDLASPALSQDSSPGCPHTLPRCSASCSTWSSCDANLSSARCRCHPGYSGLSCSTPTLPTTFLANSFVKYSLAFTPDPYHNTLQLRFRTREPRGELFRLVDQHHKEYVILEISESILQVRVNLDSVKPQEQSLSLPHVRVDDGRWHVVRVSRHGSTVVLQLDSGEGRRYNESFVFQGHQLLSVDKQEGVFAGGPTDYIGIKDNFVVASFEKGCLDDIRVDGRHLPLPPGSNGSQWGQAPVSRGVESHCHSRSACAEVQCPETFVCQDIWNDYVCTCGAGQVATADGKACTARSECLSAPCSNSGLCVDSNSATGQRYSCVCPDGYGGQHCELAQQRQTLKLGVGALCTIVGCLLLILLLVALFVAYTRRRETHLKKPTEDDVRENIISYQDEGGGEEDLNAVDLLPLKVPAPGTNPEAKTKLQVPELIEETSLDVRLEGCRRRIEVDLSLSLPPLDDLRNYAYEGNCDSLAGSLSSLESGSDCEEGVRCVVLGPRFQRLVDIYTSVPGGHLEDAV